MGSSHSKRSSSIRKIKKGKSRRPARQSAYIPDDDYNAEPVYINIGQGESRRHARQSADTPDDDYYAEPVYIDIDQAVDVPVGSRVSSQSLDSAFHEKSTSRQSSVSSCNIYDTPGHSETHQKTYCQNDDGCGGGVDGGRPMVGYAQNYLCDSCISVPPSCSGTLPKRCGTVPLDEVPYMVEAFQPYLEQTVDVNEVVVHMPFLDAEEFPSKENRKEAVALLIARIKMSDEQGKWQAFLYALKKAEYEYIVELLRGETDEDHTINRNLLKLFTPQIMNQIDPEEFIDHLFKERVINERDMEEVRCEKVRRGAIAASLMLLHKVPRRLPNWYEIFLDVLTKCGMMDMVQQFMIPEVSRHSVATKNPSDIDPKMKRNRNYKDSDNYITPIGNKETKITSLPSPTLPVPACSPTDITSHHASEQDTDGNSKYKISERYTLMRQVEELRKRIVEKKEIKQLKIQVEMLQGELEQLTEDGENVNDEGRVTNEQKPNNAEQIASLFTDMKQELKQELKQEILAMRDHVTEAVLKFMISSTSLPAYEDNPYATTLDDPVKLYNRAHVPCVGLRRPAAHQLYSVDSAMFSDYDYT